MAMFQQYQNGITPVTGVSEAGANIANIYNNALGSMGENLAKGIEKYHENATKDEILNAQAESYGNTLQNFHDTYAQNPEMAGFAKGFEPHIDQLAKFRSMSQGQKQGAILGVQAYMQQIAPRLAMYKDNLEFQTKQGINASQVDELKFGATANVNNVHLAITTPYDPNANYTEQRAAASREVDKFLAANPKIQATDKEEYLNAWHDLYRSRIANANANELNPDTKARALIQFDNAKNYQENTQTDESTGATDYGKEAEMYDVINKSAVQAKYDGLKKAEPVKPEATMAPIDNEPLYKQLEDLDSKRRLIDKQIEKAQDEGKIDTPEYKKLKKEYDDNYTQSTLLRNDIQNNISGRREQLAKEITKSRDERLAERAYKEEKPKTELETKIAVLGAELTKEAQSFIDNAIDNDKKISVSDIINNLNAEEIKRNPTIKEKTNTSKAYEIGKGLLPTVSSFARGQIGDVAVSMGGTLANAQVVTPTQPSVAKENIIKAASSLGISTEKPMTASQISDLKIQLAKQEQTTETAATVAKKKLETLSPQTVKVGTSATDASVKENVLEPTRDAQGFSTMGARIGQTVEAKEITWQEKKSLMKDWFVQTKGYVPSAFDKIFTDTHPESKLATAKTEVGDMWYDGDKWHLVPTKEVKQLTDKEISERSLYNWGTVNQRTGQVQYEERIPNSGILTLGTIKGGEKKAEAFDNLVNDTQKIREYVPQLLAMFDKAGHSIPKAEHGKAEIMMTELKAAIRVKTVGTGPVALPEHAMIAKQIGDPTAFFAWDTISKQKLETLLSTAESALKNNSAGIKVELRPAGSGSDKLSERAKLEIKLANRANKPK